MLIDWQDWLNLIIRWFHIVAGVAWIGSSFYFIWLDYSLHPPKEKDEPEKNQQEAGVFGEVWSVHGGGFYHVRKFQNAPKNLPETLHWFKWEAYSTWISGFALFVLIYYLNSKLYLIDAEKFAFTPLQSIFVSLGFLAGGWLVYDTLCRSFIARFPILFFGIAFFLICVLSYSLTHFFNSKAAFLHYGVVLGSIMVGNVFFVIIPNQKKIVAALIAGKTPDENLGKTGKQRSTHNNYFTLPVIFTMISGHYPLTFGHPYNWVILVLITFLSAFFRHYFNLKHQGKKSFWVLITSFIFILIAIFVTDWSRKYFLKKEVLKTEQVEFVEVQKIIQERCSSCHSDRPTFTGIAAAPAGISYDKPENILLNVEKIYQQVVISKIMPLGNITQMTQEERGIIAQWATNLNKK